VVGGTTITFEVAPGHPHEREVYGLLGKVRRDVNELWARVAEHNKSHPLDERERTKVTFYFGQNAEETDDMVREARQ
jgi:hypothetical protein